MRFTFNQFKLEILDILVFEYIGDFSGAIDDIAELVADQKLVVLNVKGKGTCAATMLPR
jgi:hypothetical protein